MQGSYFTMDFINEVAQMTDHSEAVKQAINVVEESNAKEHNKTKAYRAIANSKSVNSLVITMGNFFLAHPSEKLGKI